MSQSVYGLAGWLSHVTVKAVQAVTFCLSHEIISLQLTVSLEFSGKTGTGAISIHYEYFGVITANFNRTKHYSTGICLVDFFVTGTQNESDNFS